MDKILSSLDFLATSMLSCLCTILDFVNCGARHKCVVSMVSEALFVNLLPKALAAVLAGFRTRHVSSVAITLWANLHAKVHHRPNGLHIPIQLEWEASFDGMELAPQVVMATYLHLKLVTGRELVIAIVEMGGRPGRDVDEGFDLFT